MDRRDALKRLGAVGVTATAASLIVSSPAFADGGSNNSRPTVPGPPDAADFSFGSVSAGLDASTCPTPPPSSARIDYSVYQTGGSGLLGGPIQAPGLYSIGSPGGDPSGRNAGPFSLSGGAGATITIRFDLRYVCREPGGAAPAWRCRSWTRTYTYTQVVFFFVWVGAAWTEVAPTSCGTPA
jgi:hypothetical protein